MQDQKGCKNVRAEEEQITAPRAKQHEDEEGDTGIRPKKTKKQKKQKKNDRGSESERLHEEQHTC